MLSGGGLRLFWNTPYGKFLLHVTGHCPKLVLNPNQ